jgi:hypothetical protein
VKPPEAENENILETHTFPHFTFYERTKRKKEKRNYFSFQEHLIPKQILTTVRASASLSNLFFCWKKNRKKKERKTIKKVRNKDLGRESMKVLMALYQTMWK